jgi:DNA topoisomerase-1
MDTITLPEALALFQLPRALGETPEGESVTANIGRFGPYIRYGKSYVSLKEDDPYTVTLERALALIAEHKAGAASKIITAFANSPTQVLRGRFGPYITDGTRNARIPKGREPESLTLAECETLLAAAPVRKTQRRPVGGKKKKAS